MSDEKGRAWPYLLCLPPALSVLARPLENPDLWWHLSAGNRILSDLRVPRADFLSYTRAGEPWIDFEWGTQVLYALLHRAVGLPALWAFKLAVLAAVLAVVDLILRRQGQGSPGRAVALLLLSLVLLPSADLRPENLSLLLFAVQLGWLEEERRGRAAPRGPWLAAGLYALWANLHAGFVFGLGLVGLYALGAEDRGAAKRAASLAVGGLLGSLLNPYGPLLYTVLAAHGREMEDLSRFIVEWRPVALANSWAWPFWLLLALSLGAAGFSRLRGARVPRPQLLALAALAAACAQARHTAYFGVAAVVVLSRLAGPLKPLWLGPAAAGAFAYLTVFAWPKLLRAPWTVPGLPERAASFLEQWDPVLREKRLYHPYGWGGWLGWRLERPVFWDGRYLFQDLLPKVHEAMRTPDSWGAFLDSRKLDLALLEHAKLSFAAGAESGAVARPFYVWFMPRERWALVHWDPVALLFVRRGSVPTDWLEKVEFQWLRPGDEDWVRGELAAGRLGKAALEPDAKRILDTMELEAP